MYLIYIHIERIYNGILKLLHCSSLPLYREQEKKGIWKIVDNIEWKPENDINVQNIIILIIFH